MPTQKKVDIVDELAERIGRCTLAVGAAYLGLTVSEMVRLRRQLRDAGIEFRVVKNSLFRLAAQQAGQPDVAELADGPTAIAFAYGDVVTPTKALVEYQRTARNAFTVRKAFTEGQMLTVAEIEELSALPPREILAGQVAGALQGPVARLSGLLAAALTNPAGRLLSDSLLNLRGLIDARAAQLESA